MIEETLIQDGWYTISECMQCGELFSRAEPANAAFCHDCIHDRDGGRNFEAEHQANITLGREMATELL